jgi:rhamnulokinase
VHDGPVRVLAADLGASSIRVSAIDLDERPPVVRELHRFPHGPIRDGSGSLRWDWRAIVAEVERGLEAGLASGAVAGIGIDAWGVDYGLLGPDGELLSPPYSYRDGRTADYRVVAERLGARDLFGATGVLPMEIDTVFQLAAHDAEELERASRFLMLPELLGHRLGAQPIGEFTSAGTTGLVDLATDTWSTALIDGQLGIDPAIFPPIRRAGSALGAWRGIPINLVGSLDTASAVVAMGPSPGPGAAFVSTGTWIIVGAETDAALTTDEAWDEGFSNERGALGGFRLLKNVMGFWILDRCRASWSDGDWPALSDAARHADAGGRTFDASDDRFFNPPDMEAEVRAAARLPHSAGPDVVVRCILESIAATVAEAIAALGRLLGAPVDELYVVGGGTRMPLFVELLSDACAIEAHVGSSEATSLGNALVQGIALGRFEDLRSARAALARTPV